MCRHRPLAWSLSPAGKRACPPSLDGGHADSSAGGGRVLHGGAERRVVGQAGQRRPLDQLVQVLVDAQAVLRRDGVQVGIGLFPQARDPCVESAVEPVPEALPGGEAVAQIGEDGVVKVANVDGVMRVSSIRRVSDLVDNRTDESLAMLRNWLATEP